MFRDTAKPKNQMDEFLGPISPLMQTKPAHTGDHGSVSFAGGKDEAGSEMSIDSSNTSTSQRAPLGEVQNTSFPAFEFKMGASQRHQPTSKAPYGNPFAVSKQPAAAAVPDSLRMMDQRMASPEPATPASITSETRGAPAAAGGPPLTTLASLSKLSGGGSASDNSGTVTPLTNMHASHVPLSSYNSGSPEPAVTAAAAAAGKKASKLVWGDILLWKQPLQTATIFVSGLAAFGLLNFAAYGAHKMTLMSAVSYLLILDLFFNFFRYFVSKSWHEQCLWGGAAQMKHFLTNLNAQVLHLAAAHDRYLSAVDPIVTLKVAGALWASAWVGSFLSLWWAVVVGYLGAFTVPVTYQALRPSLEAAAKKIRAQTIDRIDAAGLPRTVRFLACVAVVATLWLTTSFTQSAIGFFVACTYWRTLLAPREIDAFRTVAEPYTVSAFKVGRRISTAASDVFDRMSTAGPKTRTKSHFGKQRVE